MAELFTEIGAPMTTTQLQRHEFLALDVLAQKNQDLRAVFCPGTEGSLKARCIRAGHRDLTPSLIISEDHAYCFGCGSFWWPDQFLRELGERPLVTQAIPHKRLKPDRYIPMAMVTTYNTWLNTHYAKRLEWLFARGLRLEDAINLNRLGYDGSAFVIPILDGEEVQALRFRRDDVWQDDLDTESSPKYWGLPGRNAVTLYKPRVPDWASLKSEYVYLCEGELDALRLAQEGIRAWSLTNGCRAFRPEHAEIFESQNFKILYDQDAEGRRAAQRIARMTGARMVTWPEVLGKDVTEFLQRWSLAAFMNHL